MSAIKLYYACRNIRNFGDILSLELCNHLFKKQCEYSAPLCCEAAFIGSTLEQFLYPYSGYFHKTYLGKWKKPVKIWGTGFCADKNEIIKRPKEKKEQFSRKLEISAVRGEKTRKRLEEILELELDDVTVGDPGILAAKLLNKQEIKKQYRVGIIPHYVDKDIDLNNIHVADSTIIDVCQEPMKCIEKIAECEVVLSSSLHGLIVADSLGIPNARLVLSNKITGGDYKYDDYYSAFGLKEHRKIFVNKQKIFIEDLCSIENEYPITGDMVRNRQEELVKVFPYTSEN